MCVCVCEELLHWNILHSHFQSFWRPISYSFSLPLPFRGGAIPFWAGQLHRPCGFKLDIQDCAGIPLPPLTQTQCYFCGLAALWRPLTCYSVIFKSFSWCSITHNYVLWLEISTAGCKWLQFRHILGKCMLLRTQIYKKLTVVKTVITDIRKWWFV